MTERVKNAVEQVRGAMLLKYNNFWSLAAPERRLLTMAYLADVLKVKEVGGNNRGHWVGIFLESVGLGQGYSWCAAALYFASLVADAPRPERPEYNPAAVIGWRSWAKDNGGIVDSAERGHIAMHRTTDTSGHIGVTVRSWKVWALTIEGNTSPGDEGSQDDGGGLRRRVRLKKFWTWGFSKN